LSARFRTKQAPQLQHFPTSWSWISAARAEDDADPVASDFDRGGAAETLDQANPVV